MNCWAEEMAWLILLSRWLEEYVSRIASAKAGAFAFVSQALDELA
jgi:hypothetical protein